MLRNCLSARWEGSEQLVAGVCGVLDDAAGLSQAAFQVDVLDGWQHGPRGVLGCLHHQLMHLAVVDGASSVPVRDATSQDTLNATMAVFGEDPGWHANDQK